MRLWLAVFLLVASSATASTPRELVPGLFYQRVQDLEREFPDLQQALESHADLIIDLRHAKGDRSAPALARALTSGPLPHLRLLLINRHTSATLREMSPLIAPDVVTLSPAGLTSSAEVSVQVGPSIDDAAVSSLDRGDDPRIHLLVTPQKKRNDEAALARAHANAAPAEETAPAKPSEPASPYIEDPVLFRAVQLFAARQSVLP